MSDSDSEIDNLLNQADDDLSNYRERRMAELKHQMTKVQEMKANGHGEYTEVTNEKEILRITTSSHKVLVHFYHKEFKRCQIMDFHLEKLAPRHFNTKFIKISVERAPFLVEKLKVQMLPCVVGFVNGVSADRIIGFEELGNVDTFATRVLEKRLALNQMISMQNQPKNYKPILGISQDDDEDFD